MVGGAYKLEGQHAKRLGCIFGGCYCEEVGCCWRVELGGEDFGPPVTEGGGVGEELRWILGGCFVLEMG
jgi:hypothetical protein